MKIFTQTLKIFTLATALFGMSAGVMGQAVDILPKLYMSSRNTPTNSENWVFIDSPINNSTTDYWKMILSTSSITSPSIDLKKYTNIEINIKVGTFGTVSTQANVKIEHFDGTSWTEVTTLTKPSSSSGQIFSVPITNTSSTSQIKFSTPDADSKAGARVFEIEIKGTLISTSPYISAPSSLEFEKIIINSNKQSPVNIKGFNLTSDLTISGLTAPFSSTVTTITKEQAMAEGGFDMPLTFAPTTKGSHSATLTISGGGLTNNVDISINGSAFAIEEVANITELRTKWTGTVDPTTYYKITGESLVSFANGKNYYMQDNQAGVLVYDVNTLISPALAINDGVKGITGKLELYNNMLELIVTEPTAEDVTNNNTITPVSVAAADFVANFDQYEGRLVKIANVEFPTTTTAFKSTAESLDVTSDGTSFVVRTFANSDYAGETIPTQTTVTGLAVIYKTIIQLSPRFKADIASLSTAIETPTLGEGSVFVSNGQIVVKAETAGALIEVYNIAGQRLVSQVAEAGRNSFTLAKGQIYVVKIGNLVKKVVL